MLQKNQAGEKNENVLSKLKNKKKHVKSRREKKITDVK